MADPQLQRGLCALIANECHAVSRFGPLQYPTYDLDGEDTLMEDSELATILTAITEATGIPAATEDRALNPMENAVTLADALHLPLLRALLQPDYD